LADGTKKWYLKGVLHRVEESFG